MKKRVLASFLTAVMVMGMVGCGSADESQGDAKADGEKGSYKIGLTNSFNGNSYRQQMEAYAQEAADAGIPCIIINDGPVESEAELCYQINFDTIDQMSTLTEYVCEAIGGKGKIIELRGTAGAEFDNIAHEGVLKALENYPDIEIVAEVYTDWTGSKAQSELASVLPTLDDVAGVVTQGGDSYAAVQAFEAAGMELPVIGGDNRGYFLKWWANEAPDGYDTISVSSNPWDGATGVYVACDILSGEYEVPNEMVHPFAVVTKDEAENYKDMGDEEIGTPTYDREWVRENLYK
ncbi:hypothetical protein I230019B6_00310 [Firmicutes bacterium i23-0019-B6]